MISLMALAKEKAINRLMAGIGIAILTCQRSHPLIERPRIDQHDFQLFKIRNIARYNGQPMNDCCRRYQLVPLGARIGNMQGSAFTRGFSIKW